MIQTNDDIINKSRNLTNITRTINIFGLEIFQTERLEMLVTFFVEFVYRRNNVLSIWRRRADERVLQIVMSTGGDCQGIEESFLLCLVT